MVPRYARRGARQLQSESVGGRPIEPVDDGQAFAELLLQIFSYSWLLWKGHEIPQDSHIDVFDIDDEFDIDDAFSYTPQEFREELARLLQQKAIWIRVLDVVLDVVLGVFTSSGIPQEFREELARLLQLNSIWIRVLWRQPSVTKGHHPRHGIKIIAPGG